MKSLKFFMICLGVTGCFSNPAAPPEWYSTRTLPGYTSERYLVGVGLGPWLNGRNVSQVEVRAKADLASQIQSTVSQNIRTFLSSSAEDEDEMIASRFRVISNQETRLLLTDVSRVETWVDEDHDQIAIAVVLDRLKMSRKFDQKISNLINTLEPYQKRTLDFKDQLISQKLRQQLIGVIEDEIFKAKMYCGHFFDDSKIRFPQIEEQSYRLEIMKGTEEKEKSWFPSVLSQVFSPYQVVFQQTTSRTLRCRLEVNESKNYRWPTAVAELSLFEHPSKNPDQPIWYFRFKAAHPKNFVAARELIYVRTVEELAKQLEVEVDLKVEKLLKR